jgi:hypothetical protein
MQQQGLLGQQEVSGNRALAEGLGEADFAEESGNRDFFRGLYGGELDFQRQRMLQREAEKAANKAAQGQMFGSLFGAAGKLALAGPTGGASMLLADGGVVQGPMRAIIGEGGEPEAVVPRSHPGFGLMQRFGVLPNRRFSPLGMGAGMPMRRGFSPPGMGVGAAPPQRSASPMAGRIFQALSQRPQRQGSPMLGGLLGR